jgi:hypothetical protein
MQYSYVFTITISIDRISIAHEKGAWLLKEGTNTRAGFALVECIDHT